MAGLTPTTHNTQEDTTMSRKAKIGSKKVQPSSSKTIAWVPVNKAGVALPKITVEAKESSEAKKLITAAFNKNPALSSHFTKWKMDGSRIKPEANLKSVPKSDPPKPETGEKTDPKPGTDAGKTDIQKAVDAAGKKKEEAPKKTGGGKQTMKNSPGWKGPHCGTVTMCRKCIQFNRERGRNRPYAIIFDPTAYGHMLVAKTELTEHEDKKVVAQIPALTKPVEDRKSVV